MVYPVSINCIVPVLAGDGTPAQHLGTSVADIRGLVKTVAPLPDKIRAVLITDSTGCTFYTAENDLIAYVCLLAFITMYTEVVSIIECSFTIQKVHPVESYLLGDGCRILAEVSGYFFECQSLVKGFFNVLAVFQS